MSNIATLLIVTATIFFTGTVSYSENNHERSYHNGHEQQISNVTQNPDIKVEKDEIVIVVHGIVCSFCSQGVRKKLSRLPFIDRSKYANGVKVEIEKQKVTIAVKPNSNFDIYKVFKSIRSGGYEPVVAYKNLGNKTTIVYPKKG